MALRQGSIKGRTSKKEEAFRTHLAVYLCVGLFLLTLNILTSPFDLWFYWPLFFWGWCLVFHALATYGADAPSRVPEVLRSLVPWLPETIPASPSPATSTVSAPPFAAEAFAAVHERIERLKELSWHIPDGPLRDRAIGICEAADQIAASMATDRADADTVNTFDVDLLAPAESLLAHIAHAGSHGDPDADEAMLRRAEHDLPHLQTRFDALSGRLQRSGASEPSLTGASLGVEPSTPQGMPLRSHP